MKEKVKLIVNPKSEADHQKNVMRWSMIVREVYPDLALLYHIPNGGARNEIEAKHLKEQGVKRGVPDLCLPVARGSYHGLYIELKTLTGRVSADQNYWQLKLIENGYFATVCRGWESAISVLEWYLSLKGWVE